MHTISLGSNTAGRQGGRQVGRRRSRIKLHTFH